MKNVFDFITEFFLPDWLLPPVASRRFFAEELGGIFGKLTGWLRAVPARIAEVWVAALEATEDPGDVHLGAVGDGVIPIGATPKIDEEFVSFGGSFLLLAESRGESSNQIRSANRRAA